MALPLALLAAGTALQVISQWNANQAQAAAERKNAEFYSAQAEFARIAGEREASIFQKQAKKEYGQQAAGAATTGIGGSSVLAALAEFGANAHEEYQAIKMKAAMDYKLVKMRESASKENAETLGSSQYNLLQAGASIFGGSARAVK